MRRPRLSVLRSTLAAIAFWLAAGQLMPAASSGNGEPASGTYQGRVLTELFRHRQQQARTGAAQRAALSSGSRQAVRPDIGNIAIIDDSNGVVIQANSFDLEGRGVTFVPSGDLYSESSAPAAIDQTAKNLGVALELDDDDAQSVPLPFSFPFFGQQYRQAFVHSDGNITFEQEDAGSGTRSFSRAVSGPPRLAPLFVDLDPRRIGSAVSVYTTATRIVFTWLRVPRFGELGSRSLNTFQVFLEDNGKIEFHYEDISSVEAVVGIMPGHLAGEPAAADLSEGLQQTAFGAIAEIFSAQTDLDTAVASQRFYLNHDDDYDFLVLFNNFSLSPGATTFAFELNVRNDVLGIGDLLGDTPLVDFGLEFGSPRRLASFLNMGPMSNYPDDPTTKIFGLGENSTLSVMGQEAGHRFLAYVQYLDPVSGLPSRALLGRDFAHWSFFYNSEASVVEGNRIEDKGAGISPRFTTVEAVARFSPLDQYIMGLRARDEVPPSFLVVNPSIPSSASRAPTVGVSFNGERQNIPLDLIIAAEGPRVPEASVSQKHFKFAFVLLVREGSDPAAEEIAKLERIRTQWEDFFNAAVEQRGTADTSLTRMLQLSTWPAGGVLAGWPGTGRVEISQARETNLAVELTAPGGIIGVPSTVTIPAGQTSVSFAIQPQSPGVAELNAAAQSAEFSVAHSIVSVASAASELALEVESGNEQRAGKGAKLPDPVVFRVKDANNLPYSGVEVVLSASDNSVITPAAAMSDERGRVKVDWLLGSAQGDVTLTARLERAPAVQARATATISGGRPTFSAASLVSAASFTAGPAGGSATLAPGGIHSLFGADLATATEAASSLPLPFVLGGTILRVNGIAVPLLYVSPGQINFQAPFELDGTTAEIQLDTATGVSESVTVEVRPVHPGIFFDATSGAGAILNADNTLASQLPARPGAAIQIFATGFGAVEPVGHTGIAASLESLNVTVSRPRVIIGGIEAEVKFSGLAPALAGVYQVNAIVPSGLPAGSHALQIEIGGVPSNEVFLAVQL